MREDARALRAENERLTTALRNQSFSMELLTTQVQRFEVEREAQAERIKELESLVEAVTERPAS